MAIRVGNVPFFSVFFTAKQGKTILEQRRVSQELYPAHFAAIGSARYSSGEEHPFEVPSRLSGWLEKVFLAIPGERHYLYGEPELPRVSAFYAAKNRDGNSCPLTAVYNGGIEHECHVFVFRSREQGTEIISQFPEAFGSHDAASTRKVLELLPPKSATALRVLKGQGALELCAAIDYTRSKDIVDDPWSVL